MTEKPSASISGLTFSGGQEVRLSPTEKVLLVGPNNSGKSQTLREIVAIAKDGEKARPVVVMQLELGKIGTSEDLKAFLEERGAYAQPFYRYKNWQLHENGVAAWNSPYLRQGLFGAFIKNIDASDRLAICNQQSSIGPTEQKTKPQHVLYDDEALMQRVSALFHQAFGQHLMFDFRGGSVLPIHVGDRPDKALVDRAGDEYVAAVRANPLLDQQGDGMKSYAGILFETIVADIDITLLDEPEAFLHPPQMRRLGETLASEVEGQLIVATHSSDIMRGFLEGTKGDVRVLRLRREGDRNVVSEAAPEVIRELWDRPVLRYSNALEGIFHEQTILCEDDSDCRLYNAMADHLASEDASLRKDTAYVPCGGKHGVEKIAGVLRKIGVPVKAVFDMDFLSEKEVVRRTVEALGGDWAAMEADWARLDAAVRGGKTPKTDAEIAREMIDLLSAETGMLPKRELREMMRPHTGWEEVKKHGSSGIPSGEVQTVFSRLNGRLEGCGIYLVPVGEVENFCRAIGGHGPGFVNGLLKDVPLADEKLDGLRRFTRRVLSGAHAPLR